MDLFAAAKRGGDSYIENEPEEKQPSYTDLAMKLDVKGILRKADQDMGLTESRLNRVRDENGNITNESVSDYVNDTPHCPGLQL